MHITLSRFSNCCPIDILLLACAINCCRVHGKKRTGLTLAYTLSTGKLSVRLSCDWCPYRCSFSCSRPWVVQLWHHFLAGLHPGPLPAAAQPSTGLSTCLTAHGRAPPVTQHQWATPRLCLQPIGNPHPPERADHPPGQRDCQQRELPLSRSRLKGGVTRLKGKMLQQALEPVGVHTVLRS